MTEFNPEVISSMDADYLYSIRESFPPFGNNLGTALIGSDFAVVGFSLIPRYSILKLPKTEEDTVLQPVVWFAESYKRTGMRKALSILQDISKCLGLPSISVVTPNERDVFHRQLKKQQDGLFAHPLRSLVKAGYKPIDLGELYLSVLDDIDNGDIHIAPEFKDRPAYGHMNQEMESADFANVSATALQTAFVTSLATWSYKRQRPPYEIGAASLRLY